MSQGPTPLAGIRVVDLTRFISGPFCAMFLGDLGADVIKVEHPRDGDGTRRWGAGAHPRDNPYYLSINRSKRSIGIDFKKPAGLQVLEGLIAKSDVLLINAPQGTLAEMGLSEARLREINPGLIPCEITGYGERGPDRTRGAFDFTMQAESGLMSITGEPDGAPMKVGAPIMDVLTGLTACVAVQSALYERRTTGVARAVSTSMFETALASMPNIVSDYLVEALVPQRHGNGHPNLVPYEAYAASDAWVALGLGTEPQWARFCVLIERPDLPRDPRFATNVERLEHREALNEQLRPIFARRTRAWWMQALTDNGIPCAAVNTVPEALAGEQAKALGLIQDVPHPLYGTFPMVRSPISLDHAPLAIRRAPPMLGQHTGEVLREVLGMSADEIAALRESGAVTGAA